jgi:signal transduction histidine kinase
MAHGEGAGGGDHWPEDAPGLFSDVLHDLPVGIGVYDARDDDFRVIHLNAAGRALAEVGDDVVGQPITDAYPRADPTWAVALLRRVRERGETVRVRGLVTPTGRAWNVEFRPMGGENGTAPRYILGIGYEVTEEVRAQRHLEALLRSSEPLQMLTDATTVATVAAEQGAALIPGIECAVVVPEPGAAGLMRVVGGSGPTFTGMVGRTMPLAGSLAERALQESAAVETIAAHRDSPVAATIPGAPETARLVPLVVTEPGGQTSTLGVIGYYRQGNMPYILDEQRLLDEYALRVAMALHRAALLDSVTRTAHRLRTGVEVALDLGSSLDPRLVIRRLIERAAMAVGADRCSFGRVAGEVVVIEDSVAPRGGAVEPGTRWTIEDADLLRHAVHEQRFEQIAATEPRDAGTAELMGAMGRSMIVPLLSEEKTVAVLSVSRRSADPFDEDAQAMLQQIGTIAVLALRNARLFESRRDFMNMAAHELRTPFTVLNGYLSMLRDGTFGEPGERWMQPLAVLSTKAEELGRLVDDLLIGARLERDAVSSHLHPADLVDLARAAVERGRPRADLLGGHISLEPSCPSAVVEVDIEDISRVLDNLVNNALTYTLGPPHVEVSVECDAQHARLVVADRGRGIPADQQERVFEQFYRIEDRELGYPLGTGLGLYISRRLAELHDGTLRIRHSVPREGSVFVLELPLRSES